MPNVNFFRGICIYSEQETMDFPEFSSISICFKKNKKKSPRVITIVLLNLKIDRANFEIKYIQRLYRTYSKERVYMHKNDAINHPIKKKHDYRNFELCSGLNYGRNRLSDSSNID